MKNTNHKKEFSIFGEKGFTRTLNFIKFGLFNFFKKDKNENIFENSKNRNLAGGFTLIETLVAIAIFASSITALISISARGVNDNVFVKNKLTASYLAAEGVELVRNMRDNSALSLNPSGYWANEFIAPGGENSIAGCFSTGTTGSTVNTCYIDGSVPGVYTALPCDEECPALLFDDEFGTYGYSSGQPTNFVRAITVTAVDGSLNEVIVDSSVSWEQGGKTFSTSYQYNLFDWINGF